MTFGDVIENAFASDDNPTKRGYVVRTLKRTGRLNPGAFAVITDGRGKMWECPLGDHLSVVAPSPFNL